MLGDIVGLLQYMFNDFIASFQQLVKPERSDFFLLVFFTASRQASLIASSRQTEAGRCIDAGTEICDSRRRRRQKKKLLLCSDRKQEAAAKKKKNLIVSLVLASEAFVSPLDRLSAFMKT